jgi:hypothetical protein
MEQETKATKVAGVEVVPATDAIPQQCEAAAHELGFAVPCPGLIPKGSYSTPPVVKGCRLLMVGTGCGPSRWRLWLVGSIEFPSKTRVGHLVLQGSPERRTLERFVYGPGWWPQAPKIETVGHQRFRGHSAEWIEVPEGSGSSLGGHLVLVWTKGDHTYGIGFHGYDSGARALDLLLAHSLTMIAPPAGRS